ncbi:MAG: Ig-like domain-containing protein, partial [Rubrobacteraceae bacterium]
ANGSFTYKTKKNFNGADRFVYEATDGKGGTDRATVTIRVRPVPG